MNDLRYALRMLLKSPGFSFIAIATLALGIGLNTSIFSLINDLFLRDLPFKEPGRMVHMYSNARERNLLQLAVSAPRFQHYRDAQTIFDGFAAENVFAFTLTGLGDPVQIFGGRVTANYFDVLGVHPFRGRNFLPEEQESADVGIGKTLLYSSSSIPAEIIGVVGDVRSRKVAEPDDVEVLTATALMGCLLPARRAALVDPVQALRSD